MATVARMDAQQIAQDFFADYAEALLARDAAAIAHRYAVPGLIAFPGQAIAVADPTQTEAFFASAFGQYDGVTESVPTVRVVAEAEHSIWADVTWQHDAAPTERMMYQLVRTDDVWQIAVLTPLEV